jgi:hypothetical protein
MTNEDWRIIEAMRRDGGGFVKALAECLTQADPENYRILKDAFPVYFENYRQVAEHRKHTDNCGRSGRTNVTVPNCKMDCACWCHKLDPRSATAAQPQPEPTAEKSADESKAEEGR